MSAVNTVNKSIYPWSLFTADRPKPKTAALPFTIALSREAGTDAADVAHAVGARLGWRVYDHELLERIAADAGVRAHLLESIDEQRGIWLKEAFAGLFGVPQISEPAYVHHLVRTVLALGANGECVIVGRGSPFILSAASTLRVRLVAPSGHRIDTFSKRFGIDLATASAKVAALDNERTAFVQDYFQHDPRDPHYYDLVLNTARYSVAECAELIVEGLHHRQMRRSTQNSEASVV